MNDYITPEDYGIQQKIDETNKIRTMIAQAANQGKTIIFTGGSEYWLNGGDFKIAGGKFKWRVKGKGKVIIRSIRENPISSNYEADRFLLFSGDISSSYNNQGLLTKDVNIGDSSLILNDVSFWNNGDLLHLKNTRLISTDHRYQATEGQIFKIREVDKYNNILHLEEPCEFFCPVNTFSLATVIEDSENSKQIRVTGLENIKNSLLNSTLHFNNDPIDKNYLFTIASDKQTITLGSNRTVNVGEELIVYNRGNIRQIKPAFLDIQGDFEFIRNRHEVDSSYIGVGFRGIFLQGIDSGFISGITVRNFSETAIRTSFSYRNHLYKNKIYTANRAFNGSNGTGYGISVITDYASIIESNIARECRRAVDFGGTYGISWHCVCKDNIAYGGGKDWANNPFFPEENYSTNNSAFGSHGAANYTCYLNNKSINMGGAFNLRGRSEIIKDNYAYGSSSVLINIFHGGGHIVDGFVYQDGVTERTSEDYYYNLASIIRPIRTINIQTDTSISTLPMRFQNMKLDAIENCVFYFDRTNPANFSNIEFGNIVATINNQDSFSFFKANSSRHLENLMDLGGNYYYVKEKDITFQYYWNNVVSVNNNSFNRINHTLDFITQIPVGGVVKLPTGLTTNAMIQMYDATGRNTYGTAGIVIARNNATPIYDSGSLNIEISDTILNGNDGAPNKVILSLSPTGGLNYLFIQNNTNNTIRPRIHMFGVC